MSELHQITLPSGLFPFRLKDVAKLDYGAYRLENVYQRITDQQRQTCVDMWLRNQALPDREAAWERSKQVCYLITDLESGQLVGVNTLYKDVLPGTEQVYFINRMFIDPMHRNTRLMVSGTALMLVFARTQLADSGVPGVANINENRKLSRPAAHQIFTRMGYQPLGFIDGKEVMYFEFDRISIEEV